MGRNHGHIQTRENQVETTQRDRKTSDRVPETILQEDTWTGLIREWLDHTSNQVVCVQQIYNEALKELGKPRNSEAREIGQIMNGTVTGWKAYPNPRNIPGYGKQRGWMRVETKSGNNDETFMPVEATQMEIPFDVEK